MEKAEYTSSKELQKYDNYTIQLNLSLFFFSGRSRLTIQADIFFIL